MKLFSRSDNASASVPFRNEWKYPCSDRQFALLQKRLEGVLLPDVHSGDSGFYSVHSLYFDDWKDTCAADNESGAGIRVKYRIRCYGEERKEIFLERKEKRCGKGRKFSCPLTAEETDALFRGNISAIFWQTDQPLLKQFCTAVMTRNFSPKVIVDYERMAFVEPVTHIRITFDRQITAAMPSSAGSFLSGSYPVMPLRSGANQLLEVKFDEILPGYLRQLVESIGLPLFAFSKYSMCRKTLEAVLR